MAEQTNRRFFGFNCWNNWHYDPLVKGGYTELKDKIISLKDEWESDYYRSIAEDYLQKLFEVLLARNKPFDLHEVSSCLSYTNLAMLAREIENESLMQRIALLSEYDQKDITGL